VEFVLVPNRNMLHSMLEQIWGHRRIAFFKNSHAWIHQVYMYLEKNTAEL
jgi:hypothetical protein